jgi:hypothetical protein
MNKRLKEPPPKLLELIDLANGLPPDARTTFELSLGISSRTEQEIRLQLEAALRRRLARGYEEDRRGEQDAFAVFLEQLPIHLREYIGATSDPSSRIRYDGLVVSQKLLQEIAETNHCILEILQEDSLPITEESYRQFWLAIGFERAVDSRAGLATLALDSEGKLKWQDGFLTQALKGAEVARIRICTVCGSFFWAGRINTPCCSPEHAHRLRTQRWNEKYQEKYKQQRIKKAQLDEARTSTARDGQTKSRRQKGD